MHSTLHRDKNIFSSCVFPNPFQRVLQNIQTSSLDCIFKHLSNSNTCTTTRLTPLCFQMKKRRFLSLDINISLKQHKDTYGFHNGNLVEQKQVNIDLRAQCSLQFSPNKPILSLKHSKEIKTH